MKQFDFYNLFIAIIGCIIVIFQFIHEVRYRKETKFKDTIIKTLVAKNLEVSKQWNKTEETINLISIKEACNSFSPENLQSTLICIRDYCNECASSMNSLQDLYIALLKFESEFSLSYGFDRYINIYREAYSTMPDMLNGLQRNLIPQFGSWAKEHAQQLATSPEFQKQYLEYADQIRCSCVEIINLKSKVNLYTQELGYKFDIKKKEGQ